MSNKNAQILTNIKQLIEEAMRNEIDNDPEVNKNVIDSMACLYQAMTHNFPIDGIACEDTEALLRKLAAAEEWLKYNRVCELCNRFDGRGNCDDCTDKQNLWQPKEALHE